MKLKNHFERIEFSGEIPPATWSDEKPKASAPSQMKSQSTPTRPERTLTAAQFAAYQSYKLSHPSATDDDAVLALMESGVITLPGQNPECVEKLKREFGNKKSKACGSSENVLIMDYMEENNCSMETAIINLSEAGKIKV